MLARIVPIAALVFVHVLTFAASAQVATIYPTQRAATPWPTDEWPIAAPLTEYSQDELKTLLNSAFDPGNSRALRGARGVVVIHHGELVAEGYRDGYSSSSRFISWSQAKSVTQSLIAIAARKGLLDPFGPAPIKEWQGSDDPRREITIEHLLHMESGLEFVEGEGGANDNSDMMFGVGRHDYAGYAISKPLLHSPGTVWNYATGTTNILSRIVRDAVGGDEESYRQFIQTELLDRLGMGSAIAEFDRAGTFIGGTFFYATTRDYAKFGLLYLRDGVWEGERVLPEGWVDFTRTPTKASDGKYGAQFWLDTRGTRETLAKRGRAYPADTFLTRGTGGQFVFIIPSKDLIITYNGFVDYDLTTNDEDSDVDVYITRMIEMFPDQN